MKFILKFGRWSHQATERFIYDRIYFCGLWLPFVIRYPRYSAYYRSGSVTIFGFSFQKITFLSVLSLLFCACGNNLENGMEPMEKNSPQTICPLQKKSLSESFYSGYSASRHDSIFIRFSGNQIDISHKPPNDSDGVSFFTKQNDQICFQNSCKYFLVFSSGEIHWDFAYEIKLREGPAYLKLETPLSIAVRPSRSCED